MRRRREAPLVDPATDPRRVVNLTTAAEFLAVDERTLRGWLEGGLLPCFRQGRVYRINVAALGRFRRSQGDQG